MGSEGKTFLFIEKKKSLPLTYILDVKLKLTNGTVIDIEIQASWNASFVKRTLFYWAKMYTADFKAGESYESLHKCIAINIIADGFRLNDAIHSEYVLQEKEVHTPLTDVLEIHFLDLQARSNIYVLVYVWTASLQANLVLLKTTVIHGGTEKPFAKRLSRYEA